LAALRAVDPLPVAPAPPIAPAPPAADDAEGPDAAAFAEPVRPAPAVAAPSPQIKPKRRLVAKPTVTSPRERCEGRTGFALYQCMQLQCDLAEWSAHAQCLRLRQSDAID
jgi:non-specific serine/threonine protein kinase